MLPNTVAIAQVLLLIPLHSQTSCFLARPWPTLHTAMDPRSRAPGSVSPSPTHSTVQSPGLSVFQSQTSPSNPPRRQPLRRDIAMASRAPVVAEIHTLIGRFSLFISLLANTPQVAFLAHYPLSVPDSAPGAQGSPYMHALVHAAITVSDGREMPRVAILSVQAVKERLLKAGFQLMVRIHDGGDDLLEKPNVCSLSSVPFRRSVSKADYRYQVARTRLDPRY